MSDDSRRHQSICYDIAIMPAVQRRGNNTMAISNSIHREVMAYRFDIFQMGQCIGKIIILIDHLGINASKMSIADRRGERGEVNAIEEIHHLT